MKNWKLYLNIYKTICSHQSIGFMDIKSPKTNQVLAVGVKHFSRLLSSHSWNTGANAAM